MTTEISTLQVKQLAQAIALDQISPNALKVLQRLNEAGFEACLVGGGVRDLLLGISPKDFDIATSAHPEEVRRLFRNCRLIGRRFRLAHVYFGREIIEVATFRASYHAPDHDEDEKGERATKAQGSTQQQSEAGRLLRDNVYGTIEDDVIRRDFTINALYYDISDDVLLDFIEGLEDLKNRTVRLIGDPETRYREDPVRMMRALRFVAKLDFKLASDTEAPIARLAYLLQDIPAARLFDEVIKMLMTGKGFKTLQLLRDHAIFGQLFPLTERALQDASNPARDLLRHALMNMDERLAEGKSVTPFFLYASLLWAPLYTEAAEYLADGQHPQPAWERAADYLLMRQSQHTMIPKRYSIPIRELWLFQLQLLRCHPQRAQALAEHPRFRAAYDFLLLRARANESEEVIAAAEWWTQYQTTNEVSHTSEPARDLPNKRRPRRRRRSAKKID